MSHVSPPSPLRRFFLHKQLSKYEDCRLKRSHHVVNRCRRGRLIETIKTILRYTSNFLLLDLGTITRADYRAFLLAGLDHFEKVIHKAARFIVDRLTPPLVRLLSGYGCMLLYRS